MSKKQDPRQMTLLDTIAPTETCATCGGTILKPTIGGVPRGTCRCKSSTAVERVTDWTADQVYRPLKVLPLLACCEKVIAHYESLDPARAAVAKRRGGIALFCQECKSCVEFVDGKWQRKGAA